VRIMNKEAIGGNKKSGCEIVLRKERPRTRSRRKEQRRLDGTRKRIQTELGRFESERPSALDWFHST
jgi:hypothetical protein